MKCDGCGKEVMSEEPVMDVAVSITTAGEVDAEANEWDPQLEGYVCRECVMTKTLKEILAKAS